MPENNINPSRNTNFSNTENKISNGIKGAVEALLFASDRPLILDQIRQALDNLASDEIRRVIEDLKAEYEVSGRGMRIMEVAGGFQMITAPVFAPFLKKMYKSRGVERLSKPALETLAIMAYKQPLTKVEVGSLRNVNVDGVVASLLDKDFIRVVGRKKAPGCPKVYGTTRQFLEYFGLKSLEDLPKIENFSVLEDKNLLSDGKKENAENESTRSA